MKAEDFKENMYVRLKPGFCTRNTDKILNTSTVTTKEDFPHWSYPTVLDACRKYPTYFEIVNLNNDFYPIY